MKWDDIKFSDKEKLIKYLFIRLQQNKIKEMNHTFIVNETIEPMLLPFQIYKEAIESALKSLDEEELRVMCHEFIDHSPKYWWREYYSRATYYRIKSKAMTKFLNCLHQ